MSVTRRRGALLTRAVLVTLLALVVTSCHATWGIRTSYRNYVTAPFTHGGIEVTNIATWQDGPGSGKGPFSWPITWAEFDEGTGIGTIQYRGQVRTFAHPADGGGYVLELIVGNPRLEIDGDTGTLVADLTFRPFEGMITEAPPLQSALEVELATVDLSAADLTAGADGWISIADAPVTGVPEAMELIGWDDFYGTPVEMDPFSTRFKPGSPVRAVSDYAHVEVSVTESLRPGDEIVVWGEGFDPAANIGTRPPLSGEPAGAYAVIGRFADVWAPSEGAPSSARHVIDQRWALGAESRAIVDPTGTNESYVTIDQDGRFKAVLTVGTGLVDTGNFGVYTFAGSGAVNADHERFVPIEVLLPVAAE